jgi:hypothetical protein
VRIPAQFVTRRIALCTLLLTSHALRADAVAGGAPRIRIPHVATAPRIGDYLEGRERTQELRISGLLQRDPHDGQPAVSPTTVFLSYDEKNLYAVFVCTSNAARPRAHLSRRDDLTGDETVSLLLDTLHDGRHAYEFIVNPLGIQMDGLITEGQEEDFSFDTLWRSEGRITANGFVVLMEIPFKSLRFKPDHQDAWGIAVTRYIPSTNESSTWPLLTKRIEAYVPQFASAEPLTEIQTGHNLQLTPHLFASAQRFLDQTGETPAFRSTTEYIGGVDAKYVLRQGLTLDLTANPDFSQVETDEPQVTVNQRYEVYFPEKRPFFTESASFFQTPEELFFSRRIANPQFGARFTGKVGGLTIGLLSIDDRAPEQASSGTASGSDRAHMGVARVQTDIGKESTLGVFVSQYALDGGSNRTISVDTRIKLTPNWIATAQAVRTSDSEGSAATSSGRSYLAELEHVGRHFTMDTLYSDLSPDFHPELGFIPRTDLKQINHKAGYRWHPESGAVLGFGPSLSSLVDWNHAGQLEDWQLNVPFSLQLKRSTNITAGHLEIFERYQEIPFREHATYGTFSTELLNWASLDLSYVRGTNINYYPAQGIAPFLAQSNDAGIGIVLRPTSRIRIVANYLFDQLRELPNKVPETQTRSVLNNHVLSTRVSIQFTRALSLRTIVNYGGVIANTALIDIDRSRVLGTDTLLTYMLSPGTALYAGYSNRLENLTLHSNLIERSGNPTHQTGGQAFLKISYTFRP